MVNTPSAKTGKPDQDYAFSESFIPYASRGKVALVVSGLRQNIRYKILKSGSSYLPKKLQMLRIVDGFATEIPIKNLHNFLNLLPDEAGFCLNASTQNSAFGNGIFETASAPEVRIPTETSAVRLSGLDRVWAQGYTGKGQCAAIIDSGIFPHLDFGDRIVHWKDFHQGSLEPTDSYGHGTHVAGIVAGSGEKSAGKIKGVAPEAHIIGLRISNIEQAIQALQYIIQHHRKFNCRVVNLSLGTPPTPGRNDPIAMAVQKAIDCGLIVVVSAGNRQTDRMTVTTPGTVTDAITVGAVDDHGSCDLSDDTLAPFSLWGQTEAGLQKPDLLAPGFWVYAPLSPGSNQDQAHRSHVGIDYLALSGTSQAAPAVTGLILNLLQAYPGLTRGGVRTALVGSAYRLAGALAEVQGAGEVRADLALEIALKLAEGTR